MRRRPALLVCALLASVVVGCGGGGGDEGAPVAGGGGGAGGGGEPGIGCGVVSTDEVAGLIGQDVTGASELPAGCTWTIDGPDPSSAFDWQRMAPEGFEANRVEAGGFVIEPIQGLGDEAYLRTMVSTEGDPLSVETWVLDGDDTIAVRAIAVPVTDDVIAAERSLAEALLDATG